jgi:hypothetical protein
MPVEAFISRNFSATSLERIEQANEIIEAYSAQGFTLTLRQLYYQFVARGLIENSQKSYKTLGSIINDARLAGLVDWEAIEDRTRGMEQNSHWNSPKDGIEALRSQYRIAMWDNQPERVEVWVEKEALIGVVQPTCRKLDVPYLACRGYVSQSEQWRAYRRILEKFENCEQRTTILHFGDHDPSGIDMTRDNLDRLTLFIGSRGHDVEDVVEVRRLALNMDQVELYKPPPNPAKSTDSRFAGYLRKFGDESWELDALEPRVIAELIRHNVTELRDTDLWAEKEQQLADELDTLDNIIEGLDS